MPFPLSNDLSQPESFGEDKRATLVTDSEYIIRQAFATDCRQGYQFLFRRYYQSLCSQAVRLVYSKEAAEDIVSEVFLNFWKNKVHTRITTSYRAYLFTAVRNKALNYLHEDLKRESLLTSIDSDDSGFPSDFDDPQKILQVTELYQRLNAEVSHLSPQCQRVFVLSRFDGKNHREIAAELNISTKTVEVHMLKALAQLRKVLLAFSLLQTVFFQLLLRERLLFLVNNSDSRIHYG